MKIRILKLGGQEQSSPPGQDQYSFFKSPVQKSETNIAQDIGRLGARAAESVIGLPGDILSTGLGLGSYATGGTIPSYEQVQEKLPISLPTSSQNRFFTKKLTGDYLDPKNQLQSFGDDIISDLASYVVPVGGLIGTGMKVGKAAKLAVGGNIAAQAAKMVGFGEGGQAATKIGFHLLSGFPGTRNKLTNEMSASYDKARSAIGNKTIEPTKFYRQLEETLEKTAGVKTADREFIRDKLMPLAEAINPKSVPVQKLWDEKIKLNQLLADPRTPKQALAPIKRLVGSANETLYSLGKDNPEFVKNFKIGEELHRGLRKSSEINRFFQRNSGIMDQFKDIDKAKDIWRLFYTVPSAAALKIPGGFTKTAEFIFNSPRARKEYVSILKAAVEDNANVAAKSFAKLNDIVEQESPKKVKILKVGS